MENTFTVLLHNQFTWQQIAELFLRILVACLCGAVIGLERSKRFKEAGIRTHIMVCFATALMMIVSKYAFADLAGTIGNAIGVRDTDPARIAAQVVTGISFLCAGVIFKNGMTVKGLTTAAGLWAAAGIGLAIGAGMYVLGIGATIIMTLLQLILYKVQVGFDAYKTSHLRITVFQDQEFRQMFLAFLDEHKIMITETLMESNETGEITYDLYLRVPRQTPVENITAFLMQNKLVKTVSVLPTV
ncbi:MAG: MgtC/SapB family protein [Clostridia bacterium]|nr:MgtC/SapB family protein [Clostridia bacterium]